MKVAVLGSGGWGTALAMLLVENGHDVTLWSYQAEESRHLAETGENPLLPGVKLPQGLTYTSDLACVTGCAVVVMATPSFGVRSTAGQVKDLLAPDAILVSVSKGIEKGTSLRMTQIIREVTEDKWPVVALSGPSTRRKWPGRSHGGGLCLPGSNGGGGGPGSVHQRPFPGVQQQ